MVTAFVNEWNNPGKICALIVFAAFAIKCFMRGVSRIINNDEKVYIELNSFVDDFYTRNEKDERIRKVLKINVQKFKFFMKFCMIFVFVLPMTPIIASWSIFIATGQIYYWLPLHLPYLDPLTTVGFMFNMTYITLLFGTAYLTMTFPDYYHLYLTLQVIPMVDILTLKLRQFGKDLEKLRELDGNFQADLKHEKILKSNNRIKERFIELIKEQEVYNDYIKFSSAFRKLTSFISLSMDSFNIGMSIVILRFSSVIFGLVALFYLIFMVALQCIEGSIVAHHNEKLLAEVCGFPWYELNSQEKKIFLQFIHSCQNTALYTIPIIGNLNMMLFTNVLNSAYSFLMYIIQFVDRF